MFALKNATKFLSRISATALVISIAFLSTSAHALDWTTTAFGDWEGYGLDADLRGEDLTISSYNRISGAVVYSEKVAGTWTNTVVEANVADIMYPPETETALALASDGTPHIFYYKHGGSDLKARIPSKRWVDN